MEYEQKCVICGLNALVSPSDSFRLVNECENCGRKIIFDLDSKNYLNGPNRNKFKACLYYYFRQYYMDNGKVYLISGIKDEECNTVSVNEIMSLYPRNISERIDMILQNLGAIGKYIGAEIHIEPEPETYAHIFFIEDPDYAPAEKEAIINVFPGIN